MPLLKTEYLHRDVGAPPPANPNSEVFSADAQVLPSTANAKDGTIDVVWYSGAFVPRIDRATGEPYMLKLDMQGCRFDRLNNGAPIFDTHFTGDDFKSLIAGKVGTRAQVGVVRRAWPNGDKGMATLQFDLGDEDGAEMFRKASAGILQNLSFGTFVYKREKTDLQTEGMPEGKPPFLNDKEIGMFKAVDWEPFEISPCTVPADFNTCFLSAQPTGEVTIFGTPEPGVIDALRAISPPKEKPAMPEPTTQETGADARVVNEQALAAARDEAVRAERQRVGEIESLRSVATQYGIEGAVISEFVAKGDVRRSGPKGTVRAVREEGTAGPAAASGSRRSGVSDSQRGRRLCDPRRPGAAPRLHADGDVAAHGRTFLPGAASRPQRERPRRVSQRLRPGTAEPGPRNGSRVPQLQAHRHGQGVPRTEGGARARDGRDAHRGTGPPGSVARAGVLRGRRRIHLGLPGDRGQRRQQDPAPGLRGVSAHVPAVLPAGDGAGLQAHQPRAPRRRARPARS